MLKIKDDVKLEELEKFGFEFYEEYNEWFYYGFTKPSNTSEIRIIISNDTRKIATEMDFNVDKYKIHDKIYDLFKADLIEMV